MCQELSPPLGWTPWHGSSFAHFCFFPNSQPHPASRGTSCQGPCTRSPYLWQKGKCRMCEGSCDPPHYCGLRGFHKCLCSSPQKNIRDIPIICVDCFNQFVRSGVVTESGFGNLVESWLYLHGKQIIRPLLCSTHCPGHQRELLSRVYKASLFPPWRMMAIRMTKQYDLCKAAGWAHNAPSTSV